VNIENGQGTLTNYDIFVAAGGINIAKAESFIVDITDGALTINFTATLDNAKISAIELISCTEPVINSIVASSEIVCVGSSTTLSVNGNLGSATSWYLYTESCGGTLVDSNHTGIFEVSPVNNTTYYIRGEGGCVTPGSCSKVEIQIKTGDVSVVMSGQTLIAKPAGATYQWVNCNDNIDIVGETLRFYTPAEIGSYAVRMTEDNGCSTTSSCVDVVIVGLSNDNPEEIIVHPNPAQSFVMIRLPIQYDNYLIKITDTQGRSVLTTYATNRREIDLNIETLARGVYFIQIRSEQLIKTVKLIIN
jgi:hypothetical protein